jgi:ParB-like chromosome segregation protein Spo0J
MSDAAAAAPEVPPYLASPEIRMLEQEYEPDADLTELELHPQNPNVGDIGLITESMAVNGFFGVIGVQKSTRHVVWGNHRLMTLRQNGVTNAPVLWLDIDDEAAARILLVDNEATRKGHNDEKALAELLQALAMTDLQLAGTGFDGDDLDALLKEEQEAFHADPTTWRVTVNCESKDVADELVAQLSGAGYEAKLEPR